MSTTTARPQPSAPSRSGIPHGLAALLAVLAVGAALGVGHLVGGVISPGSSPFIAVADTVVRLSPSWLTEFGKSLGPVLDKLLLQVGVGVLVVVAAALAGLASWRRPTPAVVVITVFGVLGFLAVTQGPTFAPLDLVAPVASLAVGVGAFRWLHRLARDTYDPPLRSANRATRVSRRNVLIGSSTAVGVGALAAGGAGQLLGGGVGDSRPTVTGQLARARLERAPAIPAGAGFPELGTPTFLTANADFYRVDAALLVPRQTAANWTMRVHGMVDKPVTLNFNDLLARPLVERTITLTCVSNEVGGVYISTANFVGVDLRDLLLEAGVRPGADQLFTTSIDGWTAGTPIDVVMEQDRGAMLAIGMNGEALPAEHGFPVRMVVPGLYGFVSATKWLADMEVTTFDAPNRRAYWLQRGWGQKAPIKTQSRIDSPRGFASVPTGKVTAAGIAWSQPTGIGKVEVRMDGGPWQEAELSTEVNLNTWRMWRADFELTPGSHTVQSRATDRNGVTQPEARVNPIPDGATGWPAIIFTVG